MAGLFDYNDDPQQGTLANMSPQQMGLLQAGLGMLAAPKYAPIGNGLVRSTSFGEQFAPGAAQGLAAMQEQQSLLKQQKESKLESLIKAMKLQREQEQYNALQNVDYGKLANDAGYRAKIGLQTGNNELLKGFNQSPDDVQILRTADGAYRVPKTLGKAPEQIMANGKPLIVSGDDTDLQGQLSAIKRRMAEQNKIFTVPNANGTQSYSTGNELMTPQAAKQQPSNGDIAIAQDVIKHQDRANPGALSWARGVLSGVQAPFAKQTFGPSLQDKTNQALAEKSAMNQLEIEKVNNEKANAIKVNAQQAQPYLEDIMALLPKAASGGLEGAWMDAQNYLGVDNDKSKAQAQLNIAANELTSRIPKAPGAQSDIELKYAQKQAGDLANPLIPIQARMKAAEYLYNRNKKILNGEEVKPPNSGDTSSNSELEALRKKHYGN